ncbi:tRNA-dihydrouridine(20) synthase (NAD(+)) [Starmerella bacillaris]|uniref:tRNA-dihydrouridine synthase n=1 Tax=Starmerella bacillaris TaxID=1247836 RepID=A0AAV5RLC4_STABA|nr:tRNA-dihydrouridine(20) synthase (NAD(+)) [Starmerella bacillaris]
MIDYKNVVALAPMVRVSDLPLRTLCLKYGADLVWGPEVIDKAIIGSQRTVNADLGTVDFFSKKDPTRLIWRTSPELEKSKLVFQLGSADPGLAVDAATMVAKYVSAIDLNCGCPKHFSTHAGMGAQLLTIPDKLVDILTALVKKVGIPNNVAISVKIRILDTAKKTYDLVKRIAATGVSCITVHCRTTPMRPREPAIYDYLKGIAEICHSHNVSCIVNGDIKSRSELQNYQQTYGVDGIMIAREAQTNPSCFHDTIKLTQLQVCREFIDACIKYDYNTAHCKYNLTNFVPGKDPLYAKFARAKTREELRGYIEDAEAQEKLENDEENHELASSEGSEAATGSPLLDNEPIDTDNLKRMHTVDTIPGKRFKLE